MSSPARSFDGRVPAIWAALLTVSVFAHTHVEMANEAARGTPMTYGTALAIQVVTGLWMSWIYLPGFQGLFSPANPIGMLVGVKLLLLAGTAALAVHARLRLIPNLTDDNLSGLARHIRGITALAIAFVVVGALIRLGGLG